MVVKGTNKGNEGKKKNCRETIFELFCAVAGGVPCPQRKVRESAVYLLCPVLHGKRLSLF